jgi:hypothetical protein
MIDVSVVYCPYIPLQTSGVTVNVETMKPVPPVEHVATEEGHVFILRREDAWGAFYPKACDAFNWVQAHLSRDERDFEEGETGKEVRLTIHAKETAAKFKLLFA